MAVRGSDKRYTFYEWVLLTMGEKFANQFNAFSKFGDPKSDGTTISLSQSDKWMKQAKVIDGKTCTTTDTGIAFKKFKNQRLSLVEYNKFVDELANTKKLNVENMRKSMTECGAPGTHSAAKVDHDAVVDRLTNTANYTGTHKERFDAEGKGRGIEGRANVDQNAGAGYVQGYKNKDTYEDDKKK